MERHPERIILVRENFMESVKRDLFSFTVVVAMVGVGRLIDSDALEWIGGILALLVIFGKASAFGKSSKMTLEQAEQKIREWRAE